MSFSNVLLVFFLNDACNKLTWTNNIEVYAKDDLSQFDLKLTELRSVVNNIANVCYHHNEFYMRYTMQKKKCCKSFEIHKKIIKSKLLLH